MTAIPLPWARLLLTGVLCALTLQGCATVPRGYEFKPGKDEGMVVLSTRSADHCGGSMVSATFNYEGLVGSDIKRGLFLFANVLPKPDFVDPPGYFHARLLQAGEYRLTTFQRTSTAGTIQSDDWDVRFRVQPGEVVYLGELVATFEGCRHVAIAVNDERQRDGALFDRKMSRLRASSFEHQLLDFSKPRGGNRR
jgi:hypothetical protein